MGPKKRHSSSIVDFFQKVMKKSEQECCGPSSGSSSSQQTEVEQQHHVHNQSPLLSDAALPVVEFLADLNKLKGVCAEMSCEVVNVPYDGNCLFSAIAIQLGRHSISELEAAPPAREVRAELVAYLRDHPDIILDTGSMSKAELSEYLDGMGKGEWGDGIMLSAAALLYGRPIVIVSPDGRNQSIDTAVPFPETEPMRLGLVRDHYVSIVSTSNSNTVCASTVHESDESGQSLLQSHEEERELANPACPTTTTKIDELNFDMPYHPDVSIIPPQLLRSRKFYFQQHWFQSYPWLHYDAQRKVVLCYTCTNASSHNLLRNVKYTEPTFITTGYNNWKKAVGQNGRFSGHEASNCHIVASESLHNLQQSTPVAAMLSHQLSSEQNDAQKCLRVLFTTAGYLARQGLAFRGHNEQEGNFLQMLRMRSIDVPQMESWLTGRKKSYTHHSMQDEMLKLYGDATLRCILKDVRKSQTFAIIVDGTQDINRTEQESICIRYVNEELEPCEAFVGFYAVDGTTGNMLATCIKDCLIRLQLPIENLRGQTYDGASNMSGKYNGCQAIIGREQPLAAYVHCSAHCTNLVASAVCLSSVIVRDSVQIVNDFGVLCNASGNFKSLFGKIATAYAEDEDGEPLVHVGLVRNIKPLCPTRWLVRMQAINATLSQYDVILKTLEEAPLNCSAEVSVRASGLLRRFQDPSVVMCLTIAQHVLDPLESLNRSLQSTKATVAGMLDAAKAVKSQLQRMREDAAFDKVFNDVESKIHELDLEELSVPRARKPPARFCGLAEAFQTKSVRKYFRIEYLKLVDVAIQQLSDRLIDCPGLLRYSELEAVLLTGKLDEKSTQLYPELACNGRSFQTQLDMFHSLPGMTTLETAPTLNSCCDVLRNMVPAMRAMFPHVEALIRLLLVNPASSATAERSFSSLRRLKTYLRSTCGQQRLNNLAICHIHKHVMDGVNVDELMKEFVEAKDTRSETFGHINIA